MTKDEYKIYLKSPHWKNKRREALAHFGYRCAICSSKDNLQVHHFTYENLGNEHLTDLVVLCGDCHKLIHNIK